MRNFESGGLFGLIAATLMTAVIMSFVTGSHWHWFFILGGIAVGLMATRSIRC
jgi:hypothetical protein